jgi:hypothetical protein
LGNNHGTVWYGRPQLVAGTLAGLELPTVCKGRSMTLAEGDSE